MVIISFANRGVRMNDIVVARENCAAAISLYYSDFGLLADMLGSHGEYRSFWQTKPENVLECLSDDIFNKNKGISMYEMQRVDWTRQLPIKS